MANNVVSRWLISGCYIADDLNDEEATALATKLDRLVAAAREAVIEIRQSVNPNMQLVDELTAARADIELKE